MDSDPDRFAAVIRQIEQAFADVAYPGDDEMLHPDCMDDMDIAAYYGSVSWADLPATTIAQESAALSFVSPAGFQFLLPAYMIWTLRNLTSGWASVEHTIWSLHPGWSRPELHDFQVSKFALISDEQRKAIIAFLAALAEEADDLGDDARSALESHWQSSR